jgi:rsbT antagonist protein RsbS
MDTLTTYAIPIIQLWGNLLVPLQGDISDSQAERLQGELLVRIRQTGASGLAIDVSGVSVIDSHLCALLANLVSAARLMGVTSVLCGLTPEIVMTLQAMGIELEHVETALSLELALERLGVSAGSDTPTPGVPEDVEYGNEFLPQ